MIFYVNYLKNYAYGMEDGIKFARLDQIDF